MATCAEFLTFLCPQMMNVQMQPKEGAALDSSALRKEQTIQAGCNLMSRASRNESYREYAPPSGIANHACARSPFNSCFACVQIRQRVFFDRSVTAWHGNQCALSMQ